MRRGGEDRMTLAQAGSEQLFSGSGIHQLFEAWADEIPDALAVVSEEGHLTYGELEARANQVAHALRALGVGAESLVGLCTGRCLEMMVGLLGILKAGGAYVPLDPAYPRQRLAFMLEDAQVHVLLTRSTLRAVLPEVGGRVLPLDKDRTLAEQKTSRLVRLNTPESLAYVLYTSGSTGRPKGVQIEHRSLFNLARELKQTFDLVPGSQILQYASLCFDVSVWEILAAWISGGTLHLLPVDERLPGPALLRLLRERSITHAALPPSVLAALPDAELPQLKVLVSTGEACSASVAARWSIGRRFFNAYGPTETTVHATLFEGATGERPPPIGRPLMGMSVHVLDEQLQPVLAGLPGELYIGGLGLARGYLQLPELTAERFIHHPATRERLYRSGDRVRLLPDGNLEFLGRVDHQVKIRGHRVEPAEVENVLARHPAVSAVVVKGYEDELGGHRLVAYLVLRLEASPGLSEWRRFAREMLPEYMVPAAFVELPTLPLSPNGKVDRRALPPPGRGRPALTASFRPASSPLQRTLESLWSDVLEMSPIGLDDDFLELGGDSLRAAAIAVRGRDVIGVELQPHEILEARTLSRLCERIEASPGRSAGVLPLLPIARPERVPLSFAQQRVWFFDQLVPGSAAYNLSFILRLSGPLHVPSLVSSLDALVRRHESLRTFFSVDEDGEPVQRIAPPSRGLEVPLLDLRALPAQEREARLAVFAQQELSRPFVLSTGPLIRGHLVALDETEHALLLAIHHAVCDGASMQVLVRELSVLYEAFQAGRPAALPELPVQYADYTLWQREWLQGQVLESGLSFWTKALEGAPQTLDLPVDRPRPERPTLRGEARSLQIPTPAKQALEALARAEGATPFMVLLAGLSLLLQRSTGSEDVLVGVPAAGRDRGGLEGLVGFFVNTLVVRVQLHGDPSFRELLARVRERCLAAYAHQDVPFEKLVEALQPHRVGGHQPFFQVMLALQHPPASAVTPGGLRWRLSEADIQIAPFDLTWNLWESEKGLEGTLLYDSSLFEPSTIDRLVEDFNALLNEVSAAPERRLSRLESASRWSLPLGGGVSEIERALLASPGIEDCVVRLRRPPGARPLRVAYTVAFRALATGEMEHVPLPPHLAPDLIVPIHALPLTSQGRVDEAALQRLPVLDEEVARQWEARLKLEPGMGEVAVGITPANEQPAFLHMEDVLPGFRAAASVGLLPSSASVEAMPTEELRGAPKAFSDGGPLSIPEGSPKNLVEALVRTAATAGERGITYVGPDGVPEHQQYIDLLNEARCVLTGLRSQGLGPRSRVILHIGSLRDHCTALWACILGGMTPVTVAVAPTYEAHNAVVGKLRGAWELLGHPPVLTSARLVPALQGLRARLSMEDLRLLSIEEMRDLPPAEHFHLPKPEEVAFLQLSSGSTGIPKCVQVTHDSLIHHFLAEARVNGFVQSDVTLNWLPFDHVAPTLMYHLCIVYMGHSQVHASTEWILADPLRWLDLMDAHQVTFSWSPNFGYKLVNDALRRAPHRVWRLEKIRRLMNGGEQVTVPVVREFVQRMAMFGVQPQVMQPAYGMAESSTAITYQNEFHPDTGVHWIAKASLNGRLERREAEDASAVAFVEVGLPNPGVQLRIVDSDNQLLPEGVIGRVQARGRIITPGYLYNEAANREAFVGGGWFNTGDSGFLLGGRLTLTGREKEIIIVRGSHLYCHELEELVRGIEGVDPTYVGSCAVEGAAQGTEGFAIFFTPREADLGMCSQIVTAIRARITATLGATPSFVVPVSREEFPKTTSGKIQRGALKQALASGQFSRTLKELDLYQGNANTVPHGFYRRVWRPREVSTRVPVREGACLLFLDGLGLGAQLCEALRRSGRRCVTVEPGRELTRVGRDAFLLPSSLEAYGRMLAALAEEGVSLAQVLHLWTFGGGDSEPSSTVEARQRGVFSLLFLTQALMRSPQAQEPLRLQVVSSHAQATAPDEALDCDKAPLLGLLQTVPQEVPWLDVRHLCLPLGALEENARVVLCELEVSQREREVAWRHGRRLVSRLEHINPESLGKRRPPFEAGGVYLISGGLGSLGIELSRRLLKHYQARLLLLGRTPLKETRTGELRSDWQELVGLARQSGGEVAYEAVDVSDSRGLEDAVARAEARWGRTLDGILQLAGVIEERLLAEETPEHFSEVLHPKVEGTRALDGLLSARPKTFFVGFSSVNGVFGGFSVAAYSAANRFLEHFTLAPRGGEDARRFCFSWSRWETPGQARPKAEEQLANARGYLTLSPGQGWNSLLGGLCHPPGHLLIGLDAQSPHIRARMEGGAPEANHLCAFIAGPAEVKSSFEPMPPAVKDRFGTPIPSPRRHRVERLPRTAMGTVDFEALGALGGSQQRAALEWLPPQNELEQKVASIWQEALGAERVGALDNFFELGGHSLLLVQVQGQLEQALGRPVPVLELFRYPTVRSLSVYLAGQGMARPGSGTIEDRALKQRAAQGRRRSRQALNTRTEQDE